MSGAFAFAAITDTTCDMISLDRVMAARAVLIAGPTASGKSALAMRLAEQIAATGRNAVIVNADSMQVYRELRVLTARPRADAVDQVPHRLYGTVPAWERYSIGRWLDDLAPVLAETAAAGAVPLIVGGTGLYFRALTNGLAAIPPVPADIRDAWTSALVQRGAGALHAALKERDPLTAETIRPSDPQRIQRALEVLDATGRPLREWQADAPPPLIRPDEALRIVVETDRAVLVERISTRLDSMVRDGAVDEVRSLLALRPMRDPAVMTPPPDLPALKAIGVPEIAALLRGELSLEQATDRAKLETRRYAQRQGTWFRNQMQDWERVAG